MRLLAAALACVLALFVGVGAALWMERPGRPQFRFARGGSDDAIWRLNTRTGQVSVCGTTLTGHALSEMEARLAANIRAAGHDPKKRQTLLTQIDELDDLARPRCSPWSAAEAQVNLELDAAN